DLVGIAELHAGLGQLFQQFLDRRVHQCGKLADGGLLRHSVSMSFGGGLGPARDGTILLRGGKPARCGASAGGLLPDRLPASPAALLAAPASGDAARASAARALPVSAGGARCASRRPVSLPAPGARSPPRARRGSARPRA